jgi:DNA polymerase III alpha subunit
MDSIPKYIECKNNSKKITYKPPKLEKILDVTYGCIVYQEQVMQIVTGAGAATPSAGPIWCGVPCPKRKIRNHGAGA